MTPPPSIGHNVDFNYRLPALQAIISKSTRGEGNFEPVRKTIRGRVGQNMKNYHCFPLQPLLLSPPFFFLAPPHIFGSSFIVQPARLLVGNGRETFALQSNCRFLSVCFLLWLPGIFNSWVIGVATPAAHLTLLFFF